MQTTKGGNWECIATWRPSDDAPVILGCFGQICTAQCACVETATSALLIKFLTSPLDSAIQIYEKRAIIWRSDDVFMLWLWPQNPDLERLEYIGCHVIKLCTKFEQNRTIRSGVIAISVVQFGHWRPYCTWPEVNFHNFATASAPMSCCVRETVYLPQNNKKYTKSY